MLFQFPLQFHFLFQNNVKPRKSNPTSESVGEILEVRFEDRFNHHFRYHLHHTIAYCWIPSGRNFPSPFGISLRHAGRGRYVPEINCSRTSWTNRFSPYSFEIWSKVMPLIPPLPRFFLLVSIPSDSLPELATSPFGLIGLLLTKKKNSVRGRVSLVPSTTFSTCRSPYAGEFFRAALPRASRVPGGAKGDVKSGLTF